MKRSIDIEIKILSKKDFHDFLELIAVLKKVFDMKNLKLPSQEHLQNLLNKSDFLVLVAKSGNKVIGGLTVYILEQYYSTKALAYIYDLGILKDYQRKGIGKKLIACLTDYCKENDFAEAYVEAETDDNQAVNFYRTTNFSSELQATHFIYLLEA